MPESEPTPSTIADDDYEIEHSPLEREVTRDGTTVEIRIYRGTNCSPRWLLEVEDETGGSTVWDDPFETDQEALDAALKAIDEEGIGGFAEKTTSQEARGKLWTLQCSESPLADIRRALDGSPEMMDFHEAAGVFAAVATAPTMVRPSAWMDMVKGEHIFEGIQEVQGFSQGVMALYNEVLRSVAEQDAHCVPAPTDQEAVRQFCQGYITIAAVDPSWEADERAFVELLPMFALAGVASMDKVAELLPSAREDRDAWLESARHELPATVSALYAYWAKARRLAASATASAAEPVRRNSPKIGRNAPCPCGSGKKFKRCCAG